MFHALCILLLLGFATKKTLPRVYPTMFSLDGSEATREVPKCAAKKGGNRSNRLLAGKLAGNMRTHVAFDWMHFLLLIACSSEWSFHR